MSGLFGYLRMTLSPARGIGGKKDGKKKEKKNKREKFPKYGVRHSPLGSRVLL